MKKLALLALLLAAYLFPLAAQEEHSFSDNAIDSVISEAKKHLGVPYRWGGKNPKGFDCAGFTHYVYSKFGVNLAVSAGPQYNQGTKVKLSELSVGDLVFFGGRHGGKKSIGHVGIVTSVDSNNVFHFIHASTKRGITVTSSNEGYYRNRYIGACRIFPSSPSSLPFFSSTPAAAPDDSSITFALVGDMMLGTLYPQPQLPANDGRNLFDDVADILRNADIAAGNCEGVICGPDHVCDKDTGRYSYAFRMPPDYIHLFVDAGFDFLSLANNHTNDFKLAGAKETLARLEMAGIRCAGIRGYCDTAILVRDSIRYGFCAFAHNEITCNHTDTALVTRIVSDLRSKCDILIVSFHGGAEGRDYAHLPMGAEIYLDENRGSPRHFAHHCIDLGADIVFGHGPHVPRAMEVYKGHLVAYSLGNFCTPAGISVTGPLGYAPVVTARINRHNGKLIDGRIHSFIQPFRKGPRLDSTNKVAAFIRTLTKQDFINPHLQISDDGSFHPSN